MFLYAARYWSLSDPVVPFENGSGPFRVRSLWGKPMPRLYGKQYKDEIRAERRDLRARLANEEKRALRAEVKLSFAEKRIKALAASLQRIETEARNILEALRRATEASK
jgi:hypothetical protein